MNAFLIFIIFLLPPCFSLDAVAQGGEAYNRFGFPDSWDAMRIFSDQLPAYMTEAQVRFAAGRYSGSQKLPLGVSDRLRQYNPKFAVLHYHLGIWQQQPGHNFIVDGRNWGNDWDKVTPHEEWFWHNERGERVRSPSDGKYLMNIGNEAFLEYWRRSLIEQLRSGRYQGVFLDSSSMDMLHAEARQMDPRLGKTAAMSRIFPELRGRTWSKAYEAFMGNLTRSLEAEGYATIPNINAQFTTWDLTDYWTTASGAFIEGAFMTQSADDWAMAVDRILRLAAREKIVVFQPYLRNGDEDIASRLYFLSCYLLLKDRYSYLNYFHKDPLSWYPEYHVDLGEPLKKITRVNDLRVKDALFKRCFSKGEVWVNASHHRLDSVLERELFEIIPEGGGALKVSGRGPGRLGYEPRRRLDLAPWSGAVLLNSVPIEKPELRGDALR